jgi:replicative DNA helicase
MKLIYETIISLSEQEIPIDTLTIYKELKKQGTEINAGAIASLLGLEINYTLLDTLCKMLYEKFLNKELRKISVELDKKSIDENDPFETMTWLQEETTKLENNIELNETTMSEDLPKIIEDIENRMRGNVEPGLMSSTFPSINKATGGIMSTDYVVIYGNYKQGKSTVVEQLLLDFALDKKSVGFFNLEMSKKTLYQKALSMRTGIDYLKLRNPKGHGLTEKELEWLKIYSKQLFNDTRFYVEDKVFDIDRIITKMKAWKKKYNIQLFAIDYLGLLETSQRFSARYLEMGSHSRRLKNLAKLIDTPIIVLSQANEDNKTAESKNPARDADFVISVCKPVESNITSILDKNGQQFKFTQDHFLVTMENSRHGKNKQNFVCEFQDNNFIEITLEY